MEMADTATEPKTIPPDVFQKRAGVKNMDWTRHAMQS